MCADTHAHSCMQVLFKSAKSKAINTHTHTHTHGGNGAYVCYAWK